MRPNHRRGFADGGHEFIRSIAQICEVESKRQDVAWLTRGFGSVGGCDRPLVAGSGLNGNRYVVDDAITTK